MTAEEFDSMVKDVKDCYNRFSSAIKKAVANKDAIDHFEEVSYDPIAKIEGDFKNGKPVKFSLEYKMFWNEENMLSQETTDYLSDVSTELAKITKQLGFDIDDYWYDFSGESEKHPNINISFGNWNEESMTYLNVGFVKHVKLKDSKED